MPLLYWEASKIDLCFESSMLVEQIQNIRQFWQPLEDLFLLIIFLIFLDPNIILHLQNRNSIFEAVSMQSVAASTTTQCA